MRIRCVKYIILILILIVTFILVYIPIQEQVQNQDRENGGQLLEVKVSTNDTIESDVKPLEVTTVFEAYELSEANKEYINGKSWKEGCPVALDDLSLLNISYKDFDGNTRTGEMIVHKKVAHQVCEIFKELYENDFRIEKINLIDKYNADDSLSMEDNNTSAFCFRQTTGLASYSNHALGVAIDINPMQNPYTKGNIILPKGAEAYTDRRNYRLGMIVKDDICYQAFTKRGWTWGGEWNDIKDYQHFEMAI